LPQELLEQCLQYFNTHLDLLLAVDDPCIIHRDFRAGNLIVCDDKIQGIIDWSAARASFAEEDLYFLEYGTWPINDITKKSFLTEYASIRPIPNYNAIVPLLRLNRAITVLGFTFKRNSCKNELSYLYKYNLRYLETLFKKTK
jgi:Ser/Thr protein kinase RdoA (MazF antagonist)